MQGRGTRLRDQNSRSGVLENKWRVPEFFPELDEALRGQLRVFHMELLRFNGRLNLISRRTEIDADIVHFADSILASRMILKATQSAEIYDIGSGNGFPGVILGLLDPSRRVVLIDRDARKIEFLKHLVAKLGAVNIEPKHIEIEKLPEASISCAVSRAYASIGAALLATHRAFLPGGLYFHLKGHAWSREIAEIPSQVCRIWKPSLHGHYHLPVHGAQMSLVQTHFGSE